MEFVYGKMSEAELDLTIIHTILKEDNIRKLFFSEVGFSGSIVKIYHSLMEQQSNGTMGESDIVVLVKDSSDRTNAIFIEDKINAEVMSNQRNRYDDRAKILKEREKFDNYQVILCAPKKYLDTSRSDGYEHTISYEQICENINDEFLKSIFEYAITEKHLNYVPNKCEPITEFWSQLYKYIDAHYKSSLDIVKTAGARGKSACWPSFRTNIKNLWIRWKTDRDFIDLEFGGMANNKAVLIDKLKLINETNFNIVETGKSLSLRFLVDARHHVSFSDDFYKQIDNVEYAFKAMLNFYEIVRKLQYLGVEQMPITK